MNRSRRLNTLLRHAREAYYLLHARDTERYAAWLYRRKTGHRLNLDNPRDLNEWINRLSLRTDTSQWSVLADKYRVRRYVEEKGHGDMLTELYGVWDNASDIDFAALPDRFILKANHGSAMTLAVPDRSRLDTGSARRKLDRWLHTPFGRLTAEPHYLAIPRRIIAEELLDASNQEFPSLSLIDYKIWCFHGTPRYICVYYDRTAGTVKRSVYDTGWQARPEYSVTDDSHIIPATAPLPRPKSLDAMLEAAADLAAGFPQVRVDFYAVGGRPIFGEMTFTGASGRMTSFTEEFLRHTGDLISKGFNKAESP